MNFFNALSLIFFLGNSLGTLAVAEPIWLSDYLSLVQVHPVYFETKEPEQLGKPHPEIPLFLQERIAERKERKGKKINSREELEPFLRKTLSRLATVPLINDILHAHTKRHKNKNFRIEFEPFRGAYEGVFRRKESLIALTLLSNSFYTKSPTDWAGPLVHEHTHSLMQDLYDSGSNPFRDFDPRQEAFEVAMDALRRNWRDAAQIRQTELRQKGTVANFLGDSKPSCIDMALYSLKLVDSDYPKDEWHREYIVLYPQMLAEMQGSCEFTDDEIEERRKIDSIFQPMIAYWEEYIAPDIQSLLEMTSDETVRS